jgi:large subunit ribosomal protein L25
VDVSGLGIGEAVHVSDIQIVGIEVLTDAAQVVATVVPPTVEKAAVPEPGAPEAAEPEVITAKGKEEGAEGEEAPKKAGGAEAPKKGGEGAKKG